MIFISNHDTHKLCKSHESFYRVTEEKQRVVTAGKISEPSGRRWQLGLAGYQ